LRVGNSFNVKILGLKSLPHAFPAELLTVRDNFSNPDSSQKRWHSAEYWLYF